MSLSDDIDDMFSLPPTEVKSAVVSPLDEVEEIEIDEDDIEQDPEVIEAVKKADAANLLAFNLEQETSDTKEALESLQKQKEEIAQQVAELNKQIYAIEAERSRIQSATYEKHREVRQAQREAEASARFVAVAKQNALTRKRMSVTIEGYARIAEKFPWYTGIELPDGKTVKALPHQWEGIKFLASAERAILGDEMGLGKTLTAIAALDLVKSKRALVICPAEVTSNFLREVKRWAPHRKVVSIHGQSKMERNAVLSLVAHFEPVVVIVNYEAWRKDLSLLDRLMDIQFDTLIADEAHMVKGTNTDAFSGVKKIALIPNTCLYCGGLLIKDDDREYRYCPNRCGSDGATERSIKNLWMMTGTPILNAPEDLYPMLYLIDSQVFPYKNSYLRDYCVLDYDRNKYVFRPGGLDSLVLKLSGRYLARNLQSAGVVLPPQDVIFHTVEFEDDTYLLQQDVIKQLKKHAQIVLSEDNKMNAIGVLALITRQRQANVWPGGIKVWEYPKDEYGLPLKDEPKILVFDAGEIRESIKIDKVVDLVLEHGVIGGNRVAVFSQFKTGLAELESRIGGLGLRVVRFDGDTPNNLKSAIKTNFDKSAGEEAKWDIVLCNYKTGGIGLNLTAATHTIIMDEEWNPGKRDQAYARTHRMGQDEQTFVHVVRLSHTVDTWLADLIADKEDLIGGFDSATSDIQRKMLDAIKDGKL